MHDRSCQRESASTTGPGHRDRGQFEVIEKLAKVVGIAGVGRAAGHGVTESVSGPLGSDRANAGSRRRFVKGLELPP